MSLQDEENKDLNPMDNLILAKQQQFQQELSKKLKSHHEKKFNQSAVGTKKAQGFGKKTTGLKVGSMVILSSDENSFEYQLLLSHRLAQITEHPWKKTSPKQQQQQTIDLVEKVQKDEQQVAEQANEIPDIAFKQIFLVLTKEKGQQQSKVHQIRLF